MPDAQELSRKFRESAQELAALVKDLSPEQLTTQYLPGEWTVAQNIHHMADAQAALFFRFKLMLIVDNPTLQPFDQDDFAKTPDATSANLDDSLAIIHGVHNKWADLIETLSDADWQRTAHHPEAGQQILADRVEYAANHGYAHVEQIKKTLNIS